ncbi:MAG: NAD(P)H-hydrate dehydratase [Sinomicrobium sp.]|nr:NAD(P)H-hydrate dehydratase [Sinomicrobium sp.]
MKIFSAQQLYEADKITVAKQKISSTDLMERAGKQVFNWILSRFEGTKRSIHIFCGTGNNGGDGLVIGRYLVQQHYNVRVYIVRFGTNPSHDFSVNLERLKALNVSPETLTEATVFPDIRKDDIVIDAIFGIGLSRPPKGWLASLIGHINHTGATVIAVDMPSGLYMNAVPEDSEAIVKSTFTLTFQAPKLVFFLPQTGPYAGAWETLDIGLDSEYLNKTPAEAQLTEKNLLLTWYRNRERFSHKGTYGHGLIIGGSYGKTGAAVLAAKACITSGAGLVTAYIPRCGYTVLQTALHEIMVITDKKEKHISHIDFDLEPAVIGAGTGLGTHEETQRAFIEFIKHNKTPLVIDADGLNILSIHKTALQHLPPKTVVTPHPKELERLIGPWKDDFDKLENVKAFARHYDLIVVVKGAYTIIADGDIVYINPTGNPGMATAGSGDVLTGIITGLVAQGYLPLQAAVFGVYLHGLAGDLACAHTGYEALTAGKLIDFIGNAFLTLLK